MKNSINVYWAVAEYHNPSFPLLSNKPEPVISNFIKNNKGQEYTKCPAFTREFSNTFIYKSLHDFIIDIDQKTITPTQNNTCDLTIKDPITKQVAFDSHIVFFSDESLEM